MSNEFPEYSHSPASNLDYGFDWASGGWLASGETITASVWILDIDLSKSNEQVVGGITSAFISGGVVGKVYTITNTITTSFGKIDSRSFRLSVKQR